MNAAQTPQDCDGARATMACKRACAGDAAPDEPPSARSISTRYPAHGLSQQPSSEARKARHARGSRWTGREPRIATPPRAAAILPGGSFRPPAAPQWGVRPPTAPLRLRRGRRAAWAPRPSLKTRAWCVPSAPSSLRARTPRESAALRRSAPVQLDAPAHRRDGLKPVTPSHAAVVPCGSFYFLAPSSRLCARVPGGTLFRGTRAPTALRSGASRP
jgi:hypothetical protein